MKKTAENSMIFGSFSPLFNGKKSQSGGRFFTAVSAGKLLFEIQLGSEQ